MAWAPFLCMVGLASLVLLVGVNEMLNAHKTIHWPTTTGTIINSSIGKAEAASRSYFWVPRVSFRYQIGTQTYTSSRYSASTQTGFYVRRSVERILAHHPPGSHAIVFYQPNDPGNAILAAGIGPVFSSAMRFVLLSLLFFALALNFAP